MFSILVLSLIISVIHAGAPNCPLPAKPNCLITNSQYTILATVMSQTATRAKLHVDCVWASFSNPPASGSGLVNTEITVDGFNPIGCPNPMFVAPGSTQIFFIYLQNTMATKNIYGIANQCVGPIANSTENVQYVADAISGRSNNAIVGELMGNSSICTLPSPTKALVSSPSARPVLNNAPVQPSTGLKEGVAYMAIFVCLVIACIL